MLQTTDRTARIPKSGLNILLVHTDSHSLLAQRLCSSILFLWEGQPLFRMRKLHRAISVGFVLGLVDISPALLKTRRAGERMPMRLDVSPFFEESRIGLPEGCS